VTRDDFERDARQFAGLALDSRWRDTRKGQEVRIKRAVFDEQEGIESVVLKSDLGQRTAGDFLTDVRAGRYDPRDEDADAAYLFARRTDTNDRHPAEQWATDLYDRLVSRYEIPERAVAVVGMGNDNHVYIPATPFSQEDVRAALRDMGYQPQPVDHGFGYRIVPDYDGDAPEDGDSA